MLKYLTGNSYLAREKDKRVVMLMSGGLDSNVLAAMYSWYDYEVHYLYVDYGQNSRYQEQCCVKAIVAEYGGTYHMAKVQLPWLRSSSILVGNQEVRDWDNEGESLNTIQELTYVPARNLMLLSMAQSLAEGLGISNITCAFDGAETPFTHTPLAGTTDKHPRFVKMLANTMTESSKMYWTNGSRTKIMTPLMGKLKHEIIKEGLKYGARFDLSWSCYNNANVPCMKCSACKIRSEAFKKLKLQDPLLQEILASKPGM